MRLPSDPVHNIFLQALRNVVGPGVVLGLAACSSKSGPVTLPAEDKPGAVLSVPDTSADPFCDGDRWRLIGPMSPEKKADVLYFLRAPFYSFLPHLDYAPSPPCPEGKYPKECDVIRAQAISHPVEQAGQNLAYLFVSAEFGYGVISDADALRSYLGKIDTPHEAVLIAAFSDYYFQCGQSEVVAEDGGYHLQLLRLPTRQCPNSYEAATIFITTQGEIQPLTPDTELSDWSPCGLGRSPAGLLPLVAPPASSSLGTFFAHCAYLEAASVPAFILLARDLHSFGAPNRLIEVALRSAQEEENHALMMEMLATRFGASVPEPACKETPVHTLPSFALENAVEGCVRESFSALIAAFQATTCQDPSLASMMTQIAEEETRHAQLSWDIAQWIEPLLTAEQREKSFAAQQEAILGLEKNLQIERDEEVYQFAGWPRPAQARALLQELRATLWMASSERRHNA